MNLQHLQIIRFKDNKKINLFQGEHIFSNDYHSKCFNNSINEKGVSITNISLRLTYGLNLYNKTKLLIEQNDSCILTQIKKSLTYKNNFKVFPP